ncbi:hypothetical protein METBIDRAFT_11736 [Metschnikowia bicuspidata var. bicuspidata NRRL YB-4993]|uniref:Uncharacterized protein n=1 Tax=Metschnikowia bicuspidata var. bicuspidata NRRL YB-4993 TaxID=869754 RepID=A0A1A0HAM1_9ASCO|nr:hypothetical protein METBIDRAFT_11736 [Metschnikowia bicuspidata var. bicuspidata NRRL YB-4993]OBA21174.1 hypothetical protein METBIDRAFT_11736 [Metschnikowia bicuspidata var. bicuspidata NRRL YB-4993]
MLHSPETSSPKQKSNWREKIWRLSSSPSGKSLQAQNSFLRTPKGSPSMPSLSFSPTLTPGSLKHKNPDSDRFLTPLDVLDLDHEINTLLDNQVGMLFGDWNIPPPPPRKTTGLNTNKPQLLPAKTISGPRIKPYFTKASRLDLNVNQETCFICKDILETKLDSEKLVPLECGDCVHGECLQTNVEILLEKSIKKGAFSRFTHKNVVERNVLPVCEGKHCELEGKKNQVCPISKDIISDLMKDVMLSVKLTTISSENENSDSSSALTFGTENRVSRYFFKDNQLLRPKSNAGRESQYSFSILNDTREFMADSSIRSYGPPFISNEETTRLLEEIKNKFIKHMLKRYSNFNLVVLVSLGSLRLVDKLQVAFGESQFTLLIVYLFSNFIVIETEGPSPKLFPLNEEHIITTPETSVIQFVTKSGEIPVLRLNSETDAIIEKWGIALSDHLLILPSDVITSSIRMSDIVEEESSTNIVPNQRNVIEFPSQRKNVFNQRAGPRISTVLSIEPKEIWSERSDNFEQELMKIGVLPMSVPCTDLYDTKPTSPLNIIKPQRETPKLLFENANSVDSDSEFDSDSDLELISEVMNKQRL